MSTHRLAQGPAPGAASAPIEPLLHWLLAECRAAIAAGHRPVLGLNGPVGAGKTTLSHQLQQGCARVGLQLAVASIDDAYLPWPERERRLAGNPFGVSRVPPGSHDPAALLDPIRRWRAVAADPCRGPAPLTLPRFDKRLRQGAGDRIDDWSGQADAVLLEGWLLGCRPLAEELLRTGPVQGDRSAAAWAWLLRCNRELERYQSLWAALDGLLMLWPLNWQSPRRWRLQAEARQRRSGGGWMPVADLDRLIRASLESLPTDLYQQPLLARAAWVRVLDGRRRCTWQGPGDAWIEREAQSSSPCSSATG